MSIDTSEDDDSGSEISGEDSYFGLSKEEETATNSKQGPPTTPSQATTHQPSIAMSLPTLKEYRFCLHRRHRILTLIKKAIRRDSSEPSQINSLRSLQAQLHAVQHIIHLVKVKIHIVKANHQHTSRKHTPKKSQSHQHMAGVHRLRAMICIRNAMDILSEIIDDNPRYKISLVQMRRHLRRLRDLHINSSRVE